MKTSEAIDRLKTIQKKHGDVELVIVAPSGKIIPVTLTFCNISAYNDAAPPEGMVRIIPLEPR